MLSPIPVLLLLLALPATSAIACTPDYEACGTGVLSPVRNPPCCSPTFYCYTRGPYFSQCRPVHEQHSSRLHTRVPLCAPDFGVCSAGTAPSSAIPCCTAAFVCTPAPPLYSQCLPPAGRHAVDPSRAAWFRLFPGNARKEVVSFQTLQWAAQWARKGVKVERVAAREKVDDAEPWVIGVPVERAVSVLADLPLLNDGDREVVRERVETAVGDDVVVSLERAVLVVDGVTGGKDRVRDVVAALAAFPQVRRVRLGNR